MGSGVFTDQKHAGQIYIENPLPLCEWHFNDVAHRLGGRSGVHDDINFSEMGYGAIDCLLHTGFVRYIRDAGGSMARI